MPTAPALVAPRFGAFLRDLRGQASRFEAGEALRAELPTGGMALNSSTLQGYEAGIIPPWPVLVAYARLYQVPFLDLLRELAGTLQLPDGAPVPVPLTSAALHGGDSSAAASLAQVTRLTAETQALRADLDVIAGLATQLTAIVIRRKKASAAAAERAGAPRRATGSGRPRRRPGTGADAD